MTYYRMSPIITEHSTLLDQQSHDLIPFCTGQPMPDYFEPPLVVSLDEEFIDGDLASLYLDPAVIVRKDILEAFQRLGITNIEVFPVIIEDEVNNKQITDDYMFINIIGRVACADLSHSSYNEISPDMRLIDNLVFDPEKVQGQDLFLLDEDADCIIISERVYQALNGLGLDDVYFDAIHI